MFLNAFKRFTPKKCLQFPARQCTVALNFDALKTKFTSEQQQLILNTLNTSDATHLSQLGLPLNRIKNIKTWQHKRGSFKTILEVLEVDGLGIKLLEKICTTIISNEATSVKTSNRKQYLSPPLTKELLQNLTTTTALHLGPAGISWAKLNTDNHLLNWSYFKFAEQSKKPLPTDTFKLVQSVLCEIPPADVYVFEQLSHRASLTTQNISHNQNLEVLSMLLALINTSSEHNSHFHLDEKATAPNCVYYLRSNLSARLFRTLMGTEKVSSTLAVGHLMDGVHSIDFPCKVQIEPAFKDDYLSRNAIGKELLGQALLLGVAFMEICVHKNPSSLAIVSRSKKVLNEKR